MNARSVQAELRKLSDPARAEKSKRFFKTGPGEYGQDDEFLGISVPVLRAQAKKFRHLELSQLAQILQSTYHEERLFSLFVLVLQYQKGDDKIQSEIFEFYLANTQYINNWDLVDSSSYHIIGPHLYSRDRDILYRLARSESLWERRISMIACYHFIRKQDYSTAIEISSMLLNDIEDLIHKAVGWMLREIGNRDLQVEKDFLAKNYKEMPRTMLRYAIEKFSKEERSKYLLGQI